MTGEGPFPRVVALVGGGGKTSLMFALAQARRLEGRPTICTTTTKIRPPEPETCPELLLADKPTGAAAPREPGLPDIREIREALARSGMVTVARCATTVSSPAGDFVKLAGVAAGDVAQLTAAFPDALVLVEADGAAMRPLKAPAEHEPVIPAVADLCIAVLGLDALGRPLAEADVHRSAIAARLAGQEPGTPVTAETLRRLAEHRDGLFRNSPAGCRLAAFANKVELLGQRQAAAFAAALAAAAEEDKRRPTWYLGSVREGWCAPLVVGPTRVYLQK